MADHIFPPWTVEQVQHLNWCQRRKNRHPFTCPQCRDNLGTSYLIVDGRLRRATDEEWDAAVRAVREAFESDTLDPLSRIMGIEKYVLLERELVATLDGWICPTCDYTQNWAHAF